MYFFLISLFFFIPLCAYDIIYTTTKDGITLSAHIIQPNECAKLFLHNLHAYHICPIDLVITNNTPKSWMLSGNSIKELSLVAPHIIARDIIFQYTTATTITAYGCALTGWIGTIAGAHIFDAYLPNLANSTKYISAGAALLSFIYQARMFALHRSKLYTQTHAQIMRYGLSGINTIINPEDTVNHVMFLNDKSYSEPPAQEHTFYYLFTVKLYNLHDSTETITLSVEVPKVH